MFELLLEKILIPPVLAPLIYPGLGVALATVLIILWLERKLTARVQMRIGPYYVARRLHGAIQLLADGTRFFFQEVIVPARVDVIPFLLAPALALAAIAAAFTVIPGGPGLQGFYTPYSLLVALAALAVSPLLLVLMGWASNNKFAIIGSAREALLNASYEPLLFTTALAMAILYGTLDLNQMVAYQADLGIIGLILNPLAAILFFIAMVAATDRIPFDIVMGEQEIVHGPFTEYTGIGYGLVMALDYIKLYALAMMYSIIFLGGWLPATTPLLAAIVLYVKTFIVMTVAVFLRTVYGRLRLDTALNILWSKLIPLALVSVALSTVVSYTLGW